MLKTSNGHMGLSKARGAMTPDHVASGAFTRYAVVSYALAVLGAMSAVAVAYRRW
jgi:hypothetical protein